jgi:hypothetical protein
MKFIVPISAALLLAALSIANAAVPVVTSPVSLTAIPGIRIAYQITAANSPTSFAATGLPSSWTIDTTNGVVQGRISQVATVGSNIVFSVTAANASGTSAAVSVTCGVLAQSVVAQQYRIGSTAAPAPVPFWVSEPVLPDDTVLVTGGRLLSSTVAHLAQLDNGAAGIPAFPNLGFVPWGVVTPGTATSRSLHVGIPAAWNVGIYALRLANGSTNGPAILVNAPDPWFAMGDGGMEVSSGGIIYVAGHCLAYPGQATTIALVQNGALVATLTGTSFAKDVRGWGYAVSATMPSVPYGLYEVWLHNGFGGSNGWAKVPDPISVIPSFSWPTAIVNFEGMSGADDDAKMAAAMAALPSSGGTISLPARTINLTSQLSLPNLCRLQGQGKMNTLLSFAGNTASPLIRASVVSGNIRGNFALEDLKIYAPAAFTNVAVEFAYQYAYRPGWMKRVDVQLDAPVVNPGAAQYGISVYLRQTTDFVMEDCVFDSAMPVKGYDQVFGVRLSRCTLNWRDSSLVLSGMTTHVLVDRCTFNIRGNPTVNRWTSLANPNPGIWMAAFQSGTGSIGGQYVKNVLISNCVHTRDDHSWAMPSYVGFTSDGENSIYTGPFTASETTLMLPLPTMTNYSGQTAVYNWTGCRASILEGTGAGQHRAVVAGATPGQTNLTIDRPWDVAPDSTSMIDIGCQVGNTLMISNDWSEARLIQYYFNGVNNTLAGGKVGSSDGNIFSCFVWSGDHYEGFYQNSQMQCLSMSNQFGKVQYFNILNAGSAPYVGQTSWVVRDMRETGSGNVAARTTSSSSLPVRDVLIERFPGPLTYSGLNNYAGSYAARLVDVTGTTLPSTAVRLADTPYSQAVAIAQDYATWAAGYWGTNSNTGVAAGTANPSGDGIANLMKYALGLNPLVYVNDSPASYAMSNNVLNYSFTRMRYATNITYRVVTGADLAAINWSDYWSSATNSYPSLAACIIQVVPIATSNQAGKGFFRLKITTP